MTQHFLQSLPDVVIHIKHSARARRISLRVSRLDGRVSLTVPKGTPTDEALAFAESKSAWMAKHLNDRPVAERLTYGTELPLQGELYEIKPGLGRKVQMVGSQILVPGPVDRVATRVQGFLKTLARDHLAEASDLYAARLGRSYSKLTLRDTRSRWGSCSSAGGLMYSWRLIMAPQEVLTYVAAHEVAHLAHMNHSSAFWDQVRLLYGPYDAPRRWLRAHGEKLHRYRFDD